MAVLMGLLGIEDRKTTVDQVGQKAVFDAINQIADRQSAEVDAMIQAFVLDPAETNYKEVYYLPGGGYMQDADEKGAQPGAVKSYGQWDVAYDLRDARDAMGWDDVAAAYMTIEEMDAQMETISMRHINWVRYHLLSHLLLKTNATFNDKKYGALTIRRLINNDGQPIPPLIGTNTEVTNHQHYFGSNYVASSISSTNNPFITIREHLAEHFDTGTPVVLMNPTHEAIVSALPGFVPYTPLHVTPGANTATLSDTDLANVPGRMIGAINDVAVFTWRRFPANYLFGWDLDAPKPLKQRVDEDVAASLRGFKLVAEQTDFPLTKSQWRDRRGFGVANRLNGVAMQLVASTTYTDPTIV